MSEDEKIQKLMEDHKDDFASDETGVDNKIDNVGGDISQDKPKDASIGDVNSPTDSDIKSDDIKKPEDAKEPKQIENEPVKLDDIDEPRVEQLGEKKDANTRIRQLLEEKRLVEEAKQVIERKLADKEDAEQRVRDLEEDPIYTVDDFVGTVDENGDPLTNGEATARFRAWESDYKLRSYQKSQLLKESQNTLISMQRETKEAFIRFPEFDKSNTDVYDPELAEIANTAFNAGLTYQLGHEGENNYITDSRVNPGQLLEALHKLRNKESPVTKVNNLGDDTGPIVGSRQVNKKTTSYESGFRGDVDKEMDKLIAQRSN